MNPTDDQKKAGQNFLLWIFIVLLFIMINTISSNKQYQENVKAFEREISKYGIERIITPEGHIIYFYEDKVIIK